MKLIVVDEEFERGAKCISDMSEELNEIFRLYSAAIQVLQKEGICDSAINNALSDKVDTLSLYAKEFRQISAKLVGKTRGFLENIDKADAYLYD